MTENRLYEMIYEIYEAIRDDICDRVDESADSWIRCRTSITNEELSECKEIYLENKKYENNYSSLTCGKAYRVKSDKDKFFQPGDIVVVLEEIKIERDLYLCAKYDVYQKNPESFYDESGNVNPFNPDASILDVTELEEI